MNRAYESHLPEADIGGMFGKWVVGAGFSESEAEAALFWLEFFGQLAAKVHGGG